MKRIALACLLGISACTMKMPDHKKAESVVRRFLDSTYNHKTVQILEFKGFTTMDEYRKQLKQDIIQSNKKYVGMSDTDKQKIWGKVEAILKSGDTYGLKGSKIVCMYKADGETHNAEFFIDTAFKSVYRRTELKSKTTLSSPPVY
ncbi:hypothetical protein ACFQZS_09420 [Mucilaginibacter calamicampi]|uniref:DUF3887 domain-containing protein n=1 Tax=Mucilaginibacter calamicampi TaxID=1302352 RepID=A0ABW2YV99_9SPHI